jgi:hypothetical protein
MRGIDGTIRKTLKHVGSHLSEEIRHEQQKTESRRRRTSVLEAIGMLGKKNG